MNELLVSLNSDIKRCEEVLRLNDYLEIVIALEELTDKYKNKIVGIELANDRVWNFTKKDLETLMDKLILKRNEIINNYINSNINIEKEIKNIKNSIVNDKDLSEDKKCEIIKIIDEIEYIYSKKLNKILKWEKLKKYITWSINQDVKIGSNILNLINIIISR